MKNKLQLIAFYILAILPMSSCGDWLDIEPEGQATNQKLKETGDGYRTMLSGIYKEMASADLYGRELGFGVLDCMSQQYSWEWSYSGINSANIYQKAKDFKYNDTALKDEIDKIWLKAYNVVANANSLIQAIKNESAEKFYKGEAEKEMILGEAYACRAMMHFDLCRLFAPAITEDDGVAYIPYVTEYPNIQPEAVPVNEVMKNVFADLLKAQELTAKFDTTLLGQSLNVNAEARFHDNLMFGMSGASDPNKIDDFFKGRGYRLNYYAVNALLARCYQYVGKEDSAFKYANKVLDFKAHKLDKSTEPMFQADEWYKVGMADQENERREDLKVESNIVFALYNNRSYEDYNISSFFEKKSESPTGNQLWLMLDLKGQEIFSSAATNEDESKDDARAKYLLFSPDFSGLRGEEFKLSGKWYISEDKTLRTKNFQTIPMIRGTEMRYIIAEYYAKKGNFAEAYKVLNEIRSRRGLYNPLSEQHTLADFYKDMVRDAQREWIGEGQLFYLYKRLGYAVKIGKQVRKMNKSEYMLPIPINQSM